MFIKIVIAALVLLSFNCFADDVLLQGVGAESCGSFVTAIESNKPGEIIKDNHSGKIFYTEINAKMQWIFGFIAAKNWDLPISKQVTIDRDGTALWIKKYCEKNPTKGIPAAASEFVKAHIKK